MIAAPRFFSRLQPRMGTAGTTVTVRGRNFPYYPASGTGAGGVTRKRASGSFLQPLNPEIVQVGSRV